MDLFRSDPIAQPLAARLRSTNLDEYVGQETPARSRQAFARSPGAGRAAIR